MNTPQIAGRRISLRVSVSGAEQTSQELERLALHVKQTAKETEQLRGANAQDDRAVEER